MQQAPYAKNIDSLEALKQYNNLWHVENAFRITKHDLKVRPIYHWKPHRVKAHLAICFCAFALIKYLEYRVKLQYKKISIEQIKHCLLHSQTSILYNKYKKIRYGIPSMLSKDTRKIYDILKIKYHLTPFIIQKL